MRILFILRQLPEDPGSRASWTLRRIAESVLASGAEVRLLATTSQSRAGHVSAFRLLQDGGFAPRILPAKSARRLRPEVHYTRNSGLPCRLVDVGQSLPTAWDTEFGRAFDAALEDELKSFSPHVVVMRPGVPADTRRRERARLHGAKVALALSDIRALAAAAFASTCDAAFCSTDWLAQQFRCQSPLQPVVLPPPVPLAEVAAETREPLCTTFAPPSRESGLYFLVRLAEQLSLARPDDPILVLSSAGATAVGQGLIDTAHAAGFDLGQYPNIMVGDPAATPAAMWAGARLFVAPAVAQAPIELIAEAMVNGIPVVTSDRGGATELLGGSGFALPLPFDYTIESNLPLSAPAVEPWVDIIQRLNDDDAFFESESAKTRAAASAFDPATLGPRYLEFFRSLCSSEPSHA